MTEVRCQASEREFFRSVLKDLECVGILREQGLSVGDAVFLAENALNLILYQALVDHYNIDLEDCLEEIFERSFGVIL